MKFAPVEMVKWYEYYACGTIVKDAGFGIVCDVHQSARQKTYQVLTHNELKVFSEMELEKYGSVD